MADTVRQTLDGPDEPDAILSNETNPLSALEYVPFIGMSAQVVHLIDHHIENGYDYGTMYQEAILGKTVYSFAHPGGPEFQWYSAIFQELVERGTWAVLWYSTGDIKLT
jgi:hypothetical protein